MGSRNGSSISLPWIAVTMVLVGLSQGDLDQDKQQCADSLVGLVTCLPYVGDETTAPTMDCCSKLKPVLKNNKVCLCVLIKDRDEPGLGFRINATLALGLPDLCHLPTDITECPKLMNLPRNSPEAKIFEDYGKDVNKSKASSGNETSGSMKSDVGRGKKLGSLYRIIMFIFQIA